jgi:hypothetical protein
MALELHFVILIFRELMKHKGFERYLFIIPAKAGIHPFPYSFAVNGPPGFLRGNEHKGILQGTHHSITICFRATPDNEHTPATFSLSFLISTRLFDVMQRYDDILILGKGSPQVLCRYTFFSKQGLPQGAVFDDKSINRKRQQRDPGEASSQNRKHGKEDCA